MIQIDSREKAKAITRIVDYFDKTGVKHFISKLYVGDYMNYDNPYVVVDRKQNLTEVCANVTQGHDRFRRELLNAQNAGITLIILVEHGGTIRCKQDVIWWKNPRSEKSSKAMKGETLYQIMCTLERKYGCRFEFCDKRQTGRRICELLNHDSRRD